MPLEIPIEEQDMDIFLVLYKILNLTTSFKHRLTLLTQDFKSCSPFSLTAVNMVPLSILTVLLPSVGI